MEKRINLFKENEKASSHSGFLPKNNLLKSKRSQGHIEMIISFIVFVGFVGVLLFFLNPLENSSYIDYAVLDITEEVLMQDWAVEYSVVSLTLDSPEGNCFRVPNELGLTGDLVVYDEGNNKKIGNVAGSDLYIDGSSYRHYKIYSSDSFSDGSLSGCNSLEGNNAVFGTKNTFNTVFYEDIEAFVEEYYSDYEGLKDRLGLSNDFIVNVFTQPLVDVEADLLMNASRFVPRVVEVTARDLVVVAINNDAQQIPIIINIQAW